MNLILFDQWGCSIENSGIMEEQLSYDGDGNISNENTNGINTAPNNMLMTTFTEMAIFPYSNFEQGSSVEVSIVLCTWELVNLLHIVLLCCLCISHLCIL